MTKTVAELSREIEELKTALGIASGAVTETVTEVAPDPAAPAVGTLVHVLRPVALGGELRSRGTVLTVTDALTAQTTDRFGASTLARLIDDGVLGVGEWPERLNRWQTPGDPEWSREFLAARDAARANLFPEDRAAAETALLKKFGPVPADWREPHRPVKSKWAV